MWKIKDSDTNTVKERLIAVFTIIATVISIIIIGMFILDVMNGNLDIVDGFYRCMAIVGIYLLTIIVLGLILDWVEDQ